MARTYPHVQKFVDTCIDHAKKVGAENNIPYLAILGQAALESSYGRKAPEHNYFGVKDVSSYSYGRQLIETWEYLPARYTENEIRMKFPEVISIKKLSNGKWKCKVKDWFEAYPSPTESFQHYAHVITSVSRYKKALQYADDPEQYVREIAKAGYATGLNYATTVIKVMNLLKRHIKPEPVKKKD